ncbi:DnaD and phage-associated domain-containing protein, partial [Aneurinibacillus thermoaerophilus]
NGVHSSDPLLNKTKLNNHNPHHAHTREENPISVYEQEIGRFTDMIRDNMLDWLSGEYFDEPDGIMIAAIREAAVHEKRSWSYVERVLQACLRENVRTVAQFEEKKQAFQARKQQEQAKPKHRHLHVVRNEELKEKPVVEREPIDLLEMGG